MGPLRKYNETLGNMKSTVNRIEASPYARRKSRWGSENPTGRLIGLPTAITAPMTSGQLEVYALHVRIKEIHQKLRIDNLVLADRDRRSASPSPQYDASGKRVNTRERRYRERLENERHALVETAMRTIPKYRAPNGYRPQRAGQHAFMEKVYVPVDDFPGLDFIGQLVGPRGRSLADMNAQSGANIVIRGKGSVEEGKGRSYHHDQLEPLNCLVTANNQDKVDKAKALIQSVIETVVTTPEHANERKSQQLRDLAVINGTFRDDEGRRQGSAARSLRMAAPSVVCHICSGFGHIARDCSARKARVPWRCSPG